MTQATVAATDLKVWLISLVVLCFLGCGPTPPEPQPRPSGSCGSGMPMLEIGVNDPFEARPNGHFIIEQGFQGGHHVDVSVRVVGDMDPAHTDIELILEHGDVELGRHIVADWILHADSEGFFCDYPRARLVLVDADGALLAAEEMPDLLNSMMRLKVRLSSIPGTAEQGFDVVLTDIRSLDL